MTAAVDPIELARQVADALEAASIPYAIGGALALGYWTTPRGTADVDLNVFVGADEVELVDRALDALGSIGVVLDHEVAKKEIAEGGVVRGWVGRTAVDAFFDSIPLHREAARRAVIRPLAGRPARILAAEDLSVLKMLFFRGKDVVDVERLLVSCGDRLDRGNIRRWLVECVGEGDVRVEEWDRLVASAGSGLGGASRETS